MIVSQKSITLPEIHEKGIWTQEYQVRIYEVDSAKRITLHSICNYLQESAANHGYNFGVGVPHLLKRNQTWILSKMLLRISNYPLISEKITIKTWHVITNRLYTIRDFQIYNENNECIVNATSSWFVWDNSTHRPMKCQHYIKKLHPLEDYRAIDATPQKITFDQKCLSEYDVKTRFCDTDINGHINNVKYVEWIFESYPSDYLAENQIAELEINYLAEGRHGDNLKIELQKDMCLPNTYYHKLYNVTTQKELMRARTRWEKTR